MKVRFTRRARRQLRRIYRYSEERYGQGQADRYAGALIASANEIAEFRGADRPVETRPGWFLRRVGVHRILYLAQSDEVLVLAVFHQRMDLARRLSALPDDAAPED